MFHRAPTAISMDIIIFIGYLSLSGYMAVQNGLDNSSFTALAFISNVKRSNYRIRICCGCRNSFIVLWFISEFRAISRSGMSEAQCHCPAISATRIPSGSRAWLLGCRFRRGSAPGSRSRTSDKASSRIPNSPSGGGSTCPTTCCRCRTPRNRNTALPT